MQVADDLVVLPHHRYFIAHTVIFSPRPLASLA
jgi:hypothetical protein